MTGPLQETRRGPGAADERQRSGLKVSVVVPLFNEEASVQRLLASLAAQTRSPDEVVCVDAGSTDETADRVLAFSAPFPVRLLRCGRLNPGEARNEGARAARCDWIAFADGGTAVSPGWIAALEDGVAPGTEAVYGSYEPVCDTFFRRLAAVAYVAPKDRQGWRGPAAYSLLVSRDAFERTGGFPAFRAGEDRWFFRKLEASGVATRIAVDAVARWETAPTVTATFRRFSLYSLVNLQVEHGRSWHWGLARQYALILVLAVVVARYAGFLGVAALVATWLVSRATKNAWQKRKSLDFAPLNPAVILGVAAFLVLLDSATAHGALRYLAGSHRRPKP